MLAEARAPGSIRRGAVHSVIATAVQATTQAAIAIAIARTFGPAGLGIYAWSGAVSMPLFLLAGLNLRSAQATDTAGEHPFGDYLRVRLATTGLALAAATAIGFGAAGDHAVAQAFAAVVAVRAIEAVVDVLHGAWQQEERLGWCAAAVALRSVAGCAALLASLAAGQGLAAAIACQAAAHLLALLACDLPLTRRLLAGRPVPRGPARGLALVRRTLPLGVSLGASSWGLAMPRIVLEATAGPVALGLFAAVMQVVEVGGQAVRAVGSALAPRLARLVHEGRMAEHRRLLAWSLAGAAATALVGAALSALAGDHLLVLLFGAPFAAQGGALTLAMLVAVSLYLGSLLGTAVTAQRRFDRLVIPYLAVALAGTVAATLLVPRYGFHGAIAALAVVGLAHCVAPVYVSRPARSGPDGSAA